MRNTIVLLGEIPVVRPPFVDDDEGYLAWVAQHPEGFVINTDRLPPRRYLRLHRATCSTITNVPANGTRWTGEYIKLCGERAELEAWSRNEVGTAPACPLCVGTNHQP